MKILRGGGPLEISKHPKGGSLKQLGGALKVCIL